MTDFSRARKNMVDCQIHTSNVVTPAILEAFGTVPREKFVPATMTGVAYLDGDIPLGKGRYLLEPAVLAKMIEALQPLKTEHILDIGGGTGYSAAIFSQLAERVTVLEDQAEFTDTLKSLAKGLRLHNVTAVTGMLSAGHVAGGPYDAIFINGAVSMIPDAISAQLKPGGRMIAVFKDAGRTMGQVVIVGKDGKDGLSSYPLFEAGAAYLPGLEPRTSFSFG